MVAEKVKRDDNKNESFITSIPDPEIKVIYPEKLCFSARTF